MIFSKKTTDEGVSDHTNAPDIATLRRLATAATPGPWKIVEDDHGRQIVNLVEKEYDCTIVYDANEAHGANAELIVALSPEKVLSLCDLIDSLRNTIENIKHTKTPERGS